MERLIRLISELRLENHIQLVGNIPKSEVPAFLSGGDIFINSTTAESFGISVLEAGACGLCIVSTNVGELPYLWQQGHDALLVPVGDERKMADAVLAILQDRELAQRMSMNARVKSEQFNWARVLPKWEALLEEI